jgi:hypothetical protein
MVPDVLSVLSRTPSIVRALVAGAASNALEFHECEGAWSPHQVLCHLAEAEITDWMPRIQIILGDGDDRRFPPFDREGGFVRYAGWTTDAVVNEFERLRDHNITRLQQLEVAPAALHRTGVHPEFGSVTLRQLLACWATHDLAHVNQITRSLVRHWGSAIGPWRKYYSLLADYEPFAAENQ